MDKTLLKGLRVLEHVVSSSEPVRSTDVANDLGIMKSNAHRVLKTLQHAGYLDQCPRTHTFSGSLKLWELGNQVIDRSDLRKSALAEMQSLARETGESVHLSVLDGSEVIYIDKIDSAQPIAAYTRTGGRAPAYCVATGKALLSHHEDTELKSLLTDLEKHSPSTIVDLELLSADLKLSRERGYSVNKGEWREGVWGMAAVVFDKRNKPTAALGISGPDFRLNDPDRLREMGRAVKSYAHKISHLIGGTC